MQLKSVFLPHSVPEKRLLTLVLSCIVLFLLPHPVLGQTTTFGTMVITADTTLTANHTGNIIIDTERRIILDCDGHRVIGPGVPVAVSDTLMLDIGIHLIDTTRVTVLNCFVRGFDTGFRLVEGGRNVLLGNTARNNSRNGFALVVSDRNGLNDNTLMDNTANRNHASGFALFDRRADGVFGVEGSELNDLTGNTADRNDNYGFRVNGVENVDNSFVSNDGCNNGISDAEDDDDNTWTSNDFCDPGNTE